MIIKYSLIIISAEQDFEWLQPRSVLGFCRSRIFALQTYFLRSIRLIFVYFADQFIYFLPHIHFRSFGLMFIITTRFSVMADQVTSVPSEGIKSLTARSNDVLKSVEFPKKSSKVICKSNTFSRLLAAGEVRKGLRQYLSHFLPFSIIKSVLAFSKFPFKNFSN